MKENLIKGFKLFLTIILANILCFFLVISFSVLSTVLFTKEIGYTVYQFDSKTNQQTQLYTHYSSDGEDLKFDEYQEQGLTLNKIALRSQPKKLTRIAWSSLTQLLCVSVMVAFIYNNLWRIGSKDNNDVRFKHKKEDKLSGLKIGAIASIPSVILFIVALFYKKFQIVLFAILNSFAYEYIFAVSGSVRFFGDISFLQGVLLAILLVITPLVAWFAYNLGYKSISLGELLVYKKK